MLSANDIESELSYAYLHAVAAKAGMECSPTARHSDNHGVDARIRAWGPFPSGGFLTEVNIDVQLKATISQPFDSGSALSYAIKGIERFDALRSDTVETTRILVVLFLPPDSAQWLKCAPEQLVLQRCAYWQTLRGMGPTANTNSITVSIPKEQALTPEALTMLAARISHLDRPRYSAP